MAKQKVQIENNLNLFREKFNTLSDDLGWRGQLQTVEDSDFVGAINEILGRVDSINYNILLSPRMILGDSNAVDDSASVIKGDLRIHQSLDVWDSSEFHSNLTVRGATTLDGDLNVTGNLDVRGVSTLHGGASGRVQIGDSEGNDEIFVVGRFRSSIIPESDNSHDLGEIASEWRHLHIDGTAYLDNISGDSSTITTMRGTRIFISDSARTDKLTGITNIHSKGTITSDGPALYFSGDNDSATPHPAGDSVDVVGGDGIITTVRNYGASNRTEVHIRGEHATTTNAGIASFADSSFAFDSSRVKIKLDGIHNDQLVNEYITFNDSAATSRNMNLGNTLTLKGRGGQVRTEWLADSTIEFTLDSNVNIYTSLAVGDGGISTTGNLNVQGNLSVVGDQTLTTAFIKLLSGTTTAPALDAGVSVDRGTADSAVFFWDESLDGWYAGLTTNYKLVARDSDNVSFDSGEFYGSVHVRETVNANKVHVRDDLTVADSAKIGGKLTVVSNLKVGDNIETTADLLVGDSAKVVGNLNVGTETTTSDLYVKDSAKVGGKLNVATEIRTAGDLYVGDSAKVVGNHTVGGNLIVAGDFEIRGTTTTVNTTEMNVADNQIVLNSGQTGTPATTMRSGIEVERGAETNAQLEWNDDGDYWQAGLSGAEERILTNDWVTAHAPLSWDSSNGIMSHDTVTRTDVTGTASPASAGTFDVIDSVGTTAEGHIFKVSTTTVTMPTEGAGILTAAGQLGVRVAGSTSTFAANATSDATITFALDSVGQTNTTDTPTLTFGGTFDAVSSVTHNDFGQLTAKTTSTYTMPSLPANSLSDAGIVTAGTGNASKVWKTDASGNPGWRDDANTTYALTAEQQSDNDNSDIWLSLNGDQTGVQVVGGTNITVTRTNDNYVTISATGGAGNPDVVLNIRNTSGGLIKSIYGYSSSTP